jgi:hypothetical protein
MGEIEVSPLCVGFFVGKKNKHTLSFLKTRGADPDHTPFWTTIKSFCLLTIIIIIVLVLGFCYHAWPP